MIRILIVDDHDLFRAGVRAELPADLVVVGEASDADAAVELITERNPDVVLLDVHLPGGGGSSVVERSRAAGSAAVFLALSASDAASDVVGVIQSGARGYVTKSISAAELARDIRRVAAGDAVFSPRLAGFVLDAFSTIPASSIDPELGKLSGREQEVMRLIARGYTYREIGEELYISVKTVESHVSSVLRKLQLTNRNQLTRWAAERGLL